MPDPANDNSRLLTPEQAALRLNITNDQLSALTKDGEIAYINVGRGKKRPRRRYKEEFINEFEARRTRREVPCQYTGTSVRRTISTTSNTPAIGFLAARNARRDAMLKGSTLQN